MMLADDASSVVSQGQHLLGNFFRPNVINLIYVRVNTGFLMVDVLTCEFHAV